MPFRANKKGIMLGGGSGMVYKYCSFLATSKAIFVISSLYIKSDGIGNLILASKAAFSIKILIALDISSLSRSAVLLMSVNCSPVIGLTFFTRNIFLFHLHLNKFNFT